jgi:hypothetical protein
VANPLPIRHARHDGVVSRTNSPSRSGISLSKQGHASPRRGGQPGRAPSRCDACWASARQARPDGRRRCRALASFRADGRAPPRSTDMAGDAARWLRGRGFASRRAGTHERNRAPRARDTARAVIDHEVETAQTNGQPAPRTVHYHHDISSDSRPGVPGPNERIPGTPVMP